MKNKFLSVFCCISALRTRRRFFVYFMENRHFNVKNIKFSVIHIPHKWTFWLCSHVVLYFCWVYLCTLFPPHKLVFLFNTSLTIKLVGFIENIYKNSQSDSVLLYNKQDGMTYTWAKNDPFWIGPQMKLFFACFFNVHDWVHYMKSRSMWQHLSTLLFWVTVIWDLFKNLP